MEEERKGIVLSRIGCEVLGSVYVLSLIEQWAYIDFSYSFMAWLGLYAWFARLGAIDVGDG